MIEVLALAQAVLIGYLLVRLLGPVRGLRPRWAAVTVELALGIGTGAALTATGFFLILWTGLANRVVIFGLEFVALILLAVLTWRQERASGAGDRPPTKPDTQPVWRWNKALLGVAALAMLLVVLAQVDTARKNPYGEFDAFAMWNARAKLLLGGGHTWRRAFSPLLERQRPDHPLLVPAFVARTWRLGGDQATPAAPFGVAMLFFAGVVSLLVASLTLWKGLSSGLLGFLLIVANTSFLQQSTWQYADVPLSLYFLSALVLLLFSANAEGRRKTVLLAMSGAFASMAAMTKNEGIPFLLFLFGVWFVVNWRANGIRGAWRDGRLWLAGALPGMLLEGGFKLFLAPKGGPFAGPSASQALGFLGQPDRYFTIADAVLAKLLALGSGLSHPVVLLVILALVLRFDIDTRLKPYVAVVAITLGLTFLAYCGVYLTTPDDLTWRLDTSLGRLYSQLWPSVLLLIFLVLGSPQDPPAPELSREKPDKRHGASPKGKRKKRPAAGHK